MSLGKDENGSCCCTDHVLEKVSTMHNVPCVLAPHCTNQRPI